MQLKSTRSRLALCLCVLLSLSTTHVSLTIATQATSTSTSTTASKTCPASSKDEECVPRGGGARAASISVPSSPSNALSAASALSAMKALNVGIMQSATQFWQNAERTKFLLAGAVAGIISRTAVSPLEVVATMQMVQGGDKNMLHELTHLFQSEGMRGFFKGNAANCLKVAPTRGVQFFAFENLKTRMLKYKCRQMPIGCEDTVKLSPLERLAAGGIAGMIASSMVYPLEVVKTMLTMYPGKYGSIPIAARAVVNEAGFSGLYKGLAPTLVAMFPYVGVEFMIYESAKIATENYYRRRENDGMETDSNGELIKVVLPIVVSLGLGALAGAAAQTSAHPFDVVRKRMQIQGINGNPTLYKTTIGCFKGISGKEGAGALYKGLRPACVATIPGTAVSYIVYETMKTWLGLSSV